MKSTYFSTVEFSIFGENTFHMQEASLPSLLRTLLWIIVFYYIFKFLARLLFPIVVKKMAEKAEEQIRQQYGNQQTNSPFGQQKEESAKPKEKKIVGEYIDYEEVD